MFKDQKEAQDTSPCFFKNINLMNFSCIVDNFYLSPFIKNIKFSYLANRNIMS